MLSEIICFAHATLTLNIAQEISILIKSLALRTKEKASVSSFKQHVRVSYFLCDRSTSSLQLT